jgi:hypothetical protein
VLLILKVFIVYLEHKKYSEEGKMQNFVMQQKLNTLRPINDVPKVDLKKKFKDNI